MEILIAILIHASYYGIDPILVQSIIEVESNYNPKAVGSSGERGLMQIHPKYHENPSFLISKNIAMGVKILDSYYSKCYNMYKDAWFVCYNIGPNKRLKHPKKFDYYKKVMYVYEKVSKNRGHLTRH
jgi:soluble lytic murein transglycosylase-like protein